METQGCRALVFRCFDFRITLGAFSRLLEGIGYREGDYNLASLAGSAKGLLSLDAGERDVVIKQIELSLKFHSIQEVLILYHDHCRAYGIEDRQMEDIVQRGDLQLIAADLKQRYPQLRAMAYIIKGVEEGAMRLVAVT